VTANVDGEQSSSTSAVQSIDDGVFCSTLLRDRCRRGYADNYSTFKLQDLCSLRVRRGAAAAHRKNKEDQWIDELVLQSVAQL
jgi:hypothetical protein